VSYYIDIIDTTSPLVQIIPKSASAKGIILTWNGGDTKYDQIIVGSSLEFDMLAANDADAAFIDFFTGDEHRFKTQIKNSADDSIIWQGYILPDLYSEPYQAVNFFVSFTATDGLGRLKGKYLPEEYYGREKSVIDIFCQILRLTGLELELYFAPAIENYTEKFWHKIFIDTESFSDNGKKQDAYKIFETLLSDTLCVCYQADNRWYIEGLNMRHLRNVTYKNYDAIGNLLGTVVLDRILKNITPFVTPNITMIPPYNEITINHQKIAAEFPTTITAEKNDGWVVNTGVVGIVDASAWMANGDYYAKCPAPNYNVSVYNQFYFDKNPSTTWTQDDTKFISLQEKLFFDAGSKVKFELECSIIHPTTGTEGSVSTWNDVFKYEFVYNDEVIFSNFGGTVEDREKVIFNTSGEAKISIEHILPDEGILDLKIYRPIGKVSDNGVLGIKLDKVNVVIIDFVKEFTETDLINGDFTIDKKIDLTYGEDKSGFSDGFRLAKLKEETAFYNEIEIPIIYQFEFNGKQYTQVQLDGAKLIKENKYQVYYLGNTLRILDVIYNWNGGGQMLIETEFATASTGSIFVRKYAVDTVLTTRAHWTKWTDAFYKIENSSYVKIVSNVIRRMFNVAHEKLEVTAKNAVKFNDIIQFKYLFMKDFVVLNCTWNLDENTTNLVLARANYKDSSGTNPTDENIPPIVVAGDDIFISDTATTANLLASAYDPDGTVVSQIWTKTVGASGDVIATPTALGTDLSNLTDDFYTYQIEVTDNDGDTATDAVNVIRSKNYTVSLVVVNEVMNAESPQIFRQDYKVNITPALTPGFILKFKGIFHLYAAAGFQNPYAHSGAHGIQNAIAAYNFQRNGVSVESKTIESKSRVKSESIDVDFESTMISTDELIISLFTDLGYKEMNYASLGFIAKSLANFKLQTVAVAAGVGTVAGLPLEREVVLENY